MEREGTVGVVNATQTAGVCVLARRVCGSAPYVLALGLVLLSLALLAITTIPFPALKSQLEQLTLYGHADVFTEGYHARLVALLRGVATVPLVAAGAALLFRRSIAEGARALGAAFGSFFAESLSEAMKALEKDGRLHQSMLGLILLLGLGIRVAHLFQPMRYDEAYTYTHFASTPLYLTVSNYSSTNNHILNTLLMQLSSAFFGTHPWVLRLPALVAGWLLVPATYVVTRMFFNTRAALLASALVASSSFLILFSTNARGYSLMTLFFLLVLILAPYCLRARTAAPWVLFSILSALGFYALPTMLYGTVIAAGWILLMTLSGQTGAARLEVAKRLAGATLGAAALTLFLYSPVLLVFGTKMRNTDLLPQTWERLASGVPRSAIRAWQQWNVAMPEWLGLLLIIGLLVSLVFHSRVARHRVSLAAALLWVVPVVLVQRVVPYDRVWIFLLPIYFVLGAVGLAYTWVVLTSRIRQARIWTLELASFALCAMLAWNVFSIQSVYYSDDTGTLRDGERIVAWMKNNLTPEDIVLAVTPADAPLEYYLRMADLRAADYWYSTRMRGSKIGPNHRLLAVVRDAGPELGAMLRTAGLTPSSLTEPELLQKFPESSIYRMTAVP